MSILLKLTHIRNLLKTHHLDGILIPSTNPFQTSYSPDYYNVLRWVTGFTGSSGTLLILQDKAVLFVDGRYTTQAYHELQETSIEIMLSGPHAMENWILKSITLLPESQLKISYDPWVHFASQIKHFQYLQTILSITFEPHSNLIDSLWTDRPPLTLSTPYLYDVKYAGVSSEDKRQIVAEKLQSLGASSFFISLPEDICWILNIRAQDVPYSPLVLAYGLVHQDQSLDIFLNQPERLSKLQLDLGPYVRIHALNQLEKIISDQIMSKKCVGLDLSQVPAAIDDLFKNYQDCKKEISNPISFLKAYKNDIEIQNMRQAHVWDGVALVKYFYWLHHTLSHKQISEFKAAQKLDEIRALNPQLKGYSFPTISGVNENGAIIHYQATQDSCKNLTLPCLYLVDSGGQYFQGTTDVTRTLYFGKCPSDHQKSIYTRVLKGMIGVSQLIFPNHCTGFKIDILARSSLWEVGYDYPHSTGHGVGHFLNVHEGPQSISSHPNSVPLKPGMVLSNEPGCYIKNEFGIRIENLLLVKKSPVKKAGEESMLCFETLTLAPLSLNLMDWSLITVAEKKWIETYHSHIYAILSPHLDKDQKEWLKKFMNL